MANKADIEGEWVEIREESAGDRVVFYRLGSSIPPARGRRHLELQEAGRAGGTAPGPADKYESTGSGGWSLKGDTLDIQLPGWEGEYEIEHADESKLILKRR
ncbi:hypothetical protein FMN50_09150 [Rhodobacterales bacterium]|nr:hypothetical protein FMN50_09150 [Rhodobacterales bacterium]